MIAEKNGITVDTRTAAPARKMIKCPQKTGINLNLQEDRQRDRGPCSSVFWPLRRW